MKRTLGVLLCLLTLTAAFADTVLVPGNPPLTDTMIANLQDFFEWGLSVHLTPQEASTFRAQRIHEWQSHDTDSIKTVVSLLDLRQKLVEAPPEKREQARPEVEKNLLSSLRQNPNDDFNRLMLGAYNRAHHLDEASGGPIAPPAEATTSAPNDAAPTGNLAAALPGEWRMSHVSGTSYVSAAGSHNTSGESTNMHFYADGTYKSAWYLQQSVYQCVTRCYGRRAGTWRVDGDRLTLVETESYLESHDNCRPAWNYTKHPKLSRQSSRFVIQRGRYGWQLIFPHRDIGKPDEVFDRVAAGQELIK